MDEQEQIPAATPAPPQILQDLVDNLRRVLLPIPVHLRGPVAQFWGVVRNTLTSLIAENERLIENIPVHTTGGRPGTEEIPRPDTTESTQIIRDTLDGALADLGVGVESTSAAVEAIWDIDRDWMRRWLMEKRSGIAEAAHDPKRLGCWISGNAPHDPPKSYVKFNMRNTGDPRPGKTGTLNVQPFSHQLAAVAAGFGAELRMASKTAGGAKNAGDLDISHLCHNGRCFNPDHVVVESHGLNDKRNECTAASAVRFVGRDGSSAVYHPCQHGRQERMRVCLLPEVRIDAGAYYQATGAGSCEPVERLSE